MIPPRIQDPGRLRFNKYQHAPSPVWKHTFNFVCFFGTLMLCRTQPLNHSGLISMECYDQFPSLILAQIPYSLESLCFAKYGNVIVMAKLLGAF